MNHKQIEFLTAVEKMCNAIDNQIDWHIASFQERDPEKRKLYKFLHEQKTEITNQLIKDANEQYTKIDK